jgi:hypothetical protein
MASSVVHQGFAGGISVTVARNAMDQDHILLHVLIHMDQEMFANREAIAKLLADLGVDQVPGSADVREQEPSERAEVVSEIFPPTSTASFDPFPRRQVFLRGPLGFLTISFTVVITTTATRSFDEHLGHV